MGVTRTEFCACVLAAALFVVGFVAFVRLPERNGREPYRFRTVSAATLEAADIQLLPPKSPELAVSRAEALAAFARLGPARPREVILTDIQYRLPGAGTKSYADFAWVAVSDKPSVPPLGLVQTQEEPGVEWLSIIDAVHPEAGMTNFGIPPAR